MRSDGFIIDCLWCIQAEDLESLCALAKHDVETLHKLLKQVIEPIERYCSFRKETLLFSVEDFHKCINEKIWLIHSAPGN